MIDHVSPAGGDGNTGTVVEVVNYGTQGGVRDAVKVTTVLLIMCQYTFYSKFRL